MTQRQRIHDYARSLLLITLIFATARETVADLAPHLVSDLADGAHAIVGSYPGSFISLGSVAVFTAYSLPVNSVQIATQIWRSDGTADGTFPIATPDCHGDPSNLPLVFPVGRAGRGAYYFSTCYTDNLLWFTDGTTAQRISSADLDGFIPSTCCDPAKSVVSVGDQLILTAYAPGDNAKLRLLRFDEAGRAEVFDEIHLNAVPFQVGLVAYSNGLAIAASGEDESFELWLQDGDPFSAHRVALEQNLHLQASQPLAIGSHLLFPGQSFGDGLWSFDPVQGLVQLRQFLFLGSDSPTAANWAAAAGDRAYFPATDSFESPFQVWATDGTVAGTVQVSFTIGDFALDYIDPAWITVLGDRAVFAALRIDGASALWVTGPGPFPTLLATLCTSEAPCRSRPWVAALHGHAIFRSDLRDGYQLWTTDGTVEGTRPIGTSGADAPVTDPQEPTAFGDLLYFASRDALGNAQVWRTDGTSRGTFPLSTFQDDGWSPVTDNSFGLEFNMGRAGTATLLAADDSEHGNQLWSTDGTPGSLRLLKSLFFRSGAALDISRASDGFGELFASILPTPAEAKIYRSLGRPESTREILDLPIARCSMFFPGKPPKLTPLRRHLLVQSIDCERGDSLYSFDRRSESVSLIFAPDDAMGQPFAIGFADVLGAFDDTAIVRVASSLWLTDGSPGGSRRLIDLDEQDSPLYAGRIGRRILVTGISSFGRNVVAFDLDTGEPTPLPSPPLSAYSPALVLEVPGRVFDVFIDYDLNLESVWASDGNADGSHTLMSFPGQDLPSGTFASLGDTALFFAPVGNGNDTGLWHSAGSPDSTVLVRNFGPNTACFGFALQQVGPQVFFDAGDSTTGCELWTSDGSSAGTHLVADLLPGPDSSSPFLLGVGTRLSFYGTWNGSSFSLWAIETRPFVAHEVASGLVDAFRSYLIAGDSFYFQNDDGIHGSELWRSDGTAEGTGMVADLYPGPIGADPELISASGGQVYFSAAEPTHGRGLWTLPLDPAGPCVSGEPNLCLDRGRFRVATHWKDYVGNEGVAGARPLTGDSGGFWFFDPANLEAAAKIVDGGPANGSFWFFDGSLSGVESFIEVTDTVAGTAQRYYKPLDAVTSFADTAAFPSDSPSSALARTVGAGLKAGSSIATIRISPAPPESRAGASFSTSQNCPPSSTTLCLLGGRFALSTTWRSFDGSTGNGIPFSLSDESGYFWFFGADNVELLVKMIDGHPVNSDFWLFYGALSNVEYTLTVTDTVTGAIKQYNNPLGTFASVADTSAFP